MLDVEEALTRVLDGVAPLAPERVPLRDAAGRVLAEALRAPWPLPPFDASAMDGWAVASSDFSGSPPHVLEARGESRAGLPGEEHVRGTATRIFTGALLPPGADAVVMQEDAEARDGRVTFREAPRPGAHVRRAGEDLAEDAEALPAGQRLGPGALALLASLGKGQALVRRRPRVTVLATGDELVEPGVPPPPGKIVESNGVMLAALAEACGAEARLAPLAPDHRETLTRRVREALEGTDVLLTVGGVSVGDHDLVRPVLEDQGVSLDFWKVRMRPGKPLAYGRRGACHVLGLPGNPASAFVAFALFGRPLLLALQGCLAPRGVWRSLPLVEPLRHKAGRPTFFRARREAAGVRALPAQASGAVVSLAFADCLVRMETDTDELPAGAPAPVLELGT